MRALALRVRTASRVHFQQRQMSGYAFLFPGQGSQKVGMTQELIANVPSVAGIFRTAEQVLGYDLQSLCLRGPQSVLDETVHCQPAVVVASLAALESLKLKQPEVTTPTNHTHIIISYSEYGCSMFELQKGDHDTPLCTKKKLECILFTYHLYIIYNVYVPHSLVDAV